MIIKPAFGTSLDPSENCLTLPDVALNLSTERNIATARTIGGGAYITEWSSDIQGTRRDASFLLPVAEYLLLRSMAARDNEEWLLMAQGRIFKVLVNEKSAIPEKAGMWRVVVEFIFLKEVTAA